MLCSPSISAMQFEHGSHQDGNLGSSNCSTTARTPSPAKSTIPNETSPKASTSSSSRPRHHARSFSTESRFKPASSTSAATMTATTATTTASSSSANQQPLSISVSAPIFSNAAHASTSANGADSPSIVIEAASPSPPSSATLPIRTKKSTSPTMASSTEPLPSTSNVVSTPTQSQPQPSSPPRTSGSPSKRSQTLQEIQEQEQLTLLRQQQANRRPKIARLTSALSSLPVQLKGTLTGSSSMQKSVSQDSTQGLEFPVKEQDPGVGLQIDLNCIPTPSIEDLHGPNTTSHLDAMIRDRNGNPIKPSLKSPRSSVSHFMPGRTTRSDSTPALPSNMRSSKSVPTTPTVHKAVHFDSQLEHVKVFKFKQKPTAVSRDGSPEQTETETEEEKDQFPYIWRKSHIASNGATPVNNLLLPLPQSSSNPRLNAAAMPAEVEEQLVLRLPNFPSSTRLSVDREIFLERIFLADDLRSVKGTVQVRNMSYEKWVAIRYTLDHWATIGEVSAEYSETIKGGQTDRFTFSIKLNELLNWPRGSPAHETKSMFMCLRYTVNQTEYWDNNEGHNYQLDFRKRQVPVTPLSTPIAAMANSANLAPPKANVPTSVAQNATTRNKVFELARKGGVGGKGVFAMEDLKRELDKLRSDEENEMQSIISPRTYTTDLARKKASPPSSPNGNNSRSSSPSAISPWTARYDFGQSLRNPRSGSRSTGSGRAAALDYFSAKPMSRNNSGNGTASASPEASRTSSSLAVNVAAPTPLKADRVTKLARESPDFSHRFGMISPGLGDGRVEHQPIISDSNTTSANNSPSPSPTPTPGSNSGQIPISNYSPDRFNSFPPSRHSGTSTPTSANSAARMSPAFFTPSEEFGESSTDNAIVENVHSEEFAQAVLKAGKGGGGGAIAMEEYSPSASPISEYGSPNPFSPSDSVSSVESDVTVSNLATPEDRVQKTRLVALPTHARRSINGSIGSMTGSSSSSLDSKNLAPNSITSLSNVTDDNSVEHQQQQNSAEKLRPASMSDYQELVNRFCWNSDIVPSGGSMIPDMPTNGGVNGATNPSVQGQSNGINKTTPKAKSPLPSSSSGSTTPTLL